VFVSSVTAPFLASKRPPITAPVVAVIEVRARTFPMNDEPVPSVAELPTCQYTLQGCAPLSSSTLLLDAVISVDCIWKMKTALGSPSPFSVSVPVIPKVPEAEL
jgi:hypothetical protein